MLKHQKAFTLIELMVTLTVASVIIAFAIPSFNSMIINNRSASLGDEFSIAVNFARSEALKRGTRVSLCASENGTSCTGAWTDGYIVFIDAAATDKATTPVIAAPSAVLKAWERPEGGAEISVKSGTANITFLRFTALGTLARVSANPLEIEVSVEHCTNNAARKINVGLSGMVSIERTDC